MRTRKVERSAAGLIVLAALCLAPAFPAAAATGDECNDPVLHTGSAPWVYDPNIYTTSQVFIDDLACQASGGDPTFERDAWLCWTPDCTGVARISACGGAGGTRLQLFQGCFCTPFMTPACCADDGCNGGAVLSCDVECGHSYLVRVGMDPGAALGSLTVTFDCKGQGCGPATNPAGPPSPCTQCCAAVPPFTGYAAPVVFGTDSGDFPGSRVVHAFSLAGFGTQTPGYWAPPRWEDPSWTMSTLGSVFGVTVDDDGDVYLSHFALYPQHVVGSVGGGTGAVIQLDRLTAQPSLLVSLPQSAAGPGLGNLTWSCDHHSLYVTDFEDGRIYRVDPAQPSASRIRSAWDYATDVLDLSGAAEAGDGPGIVPLGERVWAVAAGPDRLFFSVWRRDLANAFGFPNLIASVSLDAAGDPVPGTTRVEISLGGGFRPTPVADLAFDAQCCLFAAQRTMYGLQSGAHDSELLKFCWEAKGSAGQWVESGSFAVGLDTSYPASAAGGVSVDGGPGGWVWATGDYLLQAPWTYGIQGLPTTGGGTNDALCIDMDGDATQQPDSDKVRQGSCEVVCLAEASCSASIDSVECLLGPDGFPNGSYSILLTVVNNTPATADQLLLPSLATWIPLVPPLPTGGSRTVKLVITAPPGPYSLPVGLFDSAGGTFCCGAEAVTELPECTCLIFTEVEVNCADVQPAGGAAFTFTFTAAFVEQWVGAHLFLIPPAGAPWSVQPVYSNVFPLPGGSSWSPQNPFTLLFQPPPVPGPDGMWHITLPVSIHSADLSLCCVAELHLSGPWPCERPCGVDLNGDGVVDGADLAALLAAWGTDDPCADLNNDGIVNGADLAILLGAWG